MNETDRLKETYEQTRYQISGHGKRDIRVLKEAMEDIDGHLKSDIYGKGQVIEDFQAKMAALLGKESAVFFPSGTMAQQIAMRIWCDEKDLKKVAYHPLSHLEIHEEDGLKKLHHIETVLLADQTRVIELEDVAGMEEDVACILLELPQREIGGQLPSYETLEQISAYCREKGIKLHLDGARLLEVLPYYRKTAAEVCNLFDSVYLSFYKGIGGIAGAILAGDEDFTARSKVWKKRCGGDLISLYPYILSADYYFERRAHRMGEYYQGALELARLFNACHGVTTLPPVPVSNMFHLYFHQAKERVAAVLADIQNKTGIGITVYLTEMDENTCYCEISVGDQLAKAPPEDVAQMVRLLDETMKNAI